MHAYGPLIATFAIALVWPCQIHAEEGMKRSCPLVIQSPRPDGSLPSMPCRKASLPSMQEIPTACMARFRWRRKPKVSPGDDGHIVIDQEGFMPVSYCKSEGYETFFFKTPLTHLSPLSLDDFVLYDKDIVVQEDPSIFRKLGEALHYHFTGLATRKPDHHRVEGVLGYPADYYVWEVGGSTVFLKAYQETTPMV